MTTQQARNNTINNMMLSSGMLTTNMSMQSNTKKQGR